MFTGIIEEVGTISKIKTLQGGRRITIKAQKVIDDLDIDHSIAVSGVCLTVVELEKGGFTVEAVGETLQKTTLSRSKSGMSVNLERALRFNDRLGGHLVQGHVNGMGNITSSDKKGESWYLELEIPASLSKYVIPEGSIAVDGISLTIAQLMENRLAISVIPHTYKNTTVSSYKIGQMVNIEIDFLARYVEKILLNTSFERKNATFSQEWFKRLGF